MIRTRSMTSRRHLAHYPARFAAMCVCSLLMTGCQSLTTASPATHLRIVDLSASAGTLDIYQGGHAVAYNLSYGTVTSYIGLTPGASTMIAAPAGSKQTLSTAKAAFLRGERYTLLLHGPLSGLQQTVLADQSPADGPSIRVLHQAERTGPVDIYLVPAGHRLASLAPVAANLLPGAATGYLSVPEGISAAIVLPAGARPSASSPVLHTGRQTDYVRGSARTLVLLDAPPTLARSLDVIEMADEETPN